MEAPPKAVSVLEAIHQRRAVRAYRPDPVPEATVRQLLEAATWAPTAIHEEPWAFVVVQDRERLKQLSDRAKARLFDRVRVAQPHAPARSSHLRDLVADSSFNVFYDAGTLIVICGRPMSEYVVADCWLAAENLMLAAHALGLGSCPIGFAVDALNSREVKAELGIPPEVVAVAPIIVGYPAGEPGEGKRKPPELLSWK